MNTFHRWIVTALMSCGKTLAESLAFIDKVSGDSFVDHKEKMMKAISEGEKRVIISTDVWSHGINFTGIRFVVNAGFSPNEDVHQMKHVVMGEMVWHVLFYFLVLAIVLSN